MCECSSSNCGCINTSKLPIGPTGVNGTNGINGLFGGYSSSWLFDSSNTTIPANDYISTNNSDETLVTIIYISPLNINTVDLTAFLGSFTNSGYFGKIRIFNTINSNSFFYYEITGVTLNGGTGIYEIDVTYIDGNPTSPLINLDSIVISFTPNPPSGVYTENLSPTGVGSIIDNITNPATYITKSFPAVVTTGIYDVTITPAIQTAITDRCYINIAIAINGTVPGGLSQNPFVHTIDLIVGNTSGVYQNAFTPQITRRLSLTAGDILSLYALDIASIGNARNVDMALTYIKVG